MNNVYYNPISTHKKISTPPSIVGTVIAIFVTTLLIYKTKVIKFPRTGNSGTFFLAPLTILLYFQWEWQAKIQNAPYIAIECRAKYISMWK